MKTLPFLLPIAVVLLPLRAQEARPGAAVRVSIQRFSSEGAPPNLDALRSILPNLLQAGVFQFEWLSAVVSSDGAQQASPGGNSRENQFVIHGQYIQLGQKIRVDVLVNRSRDGSNFTADFAMFAPADMTAEMQKLAVRCAQALMPARQAGATGPGVMVSRSFTNAKRQSKISYLSAMIPRAIVRAAEGANLGQVSLAASANGSGQPRFQVTGSFHTVADRILVDVKVADLSGDNLTFAVESTDKFGFSLPATVAGRVLEVVRGMGEQTASEDTVYHPEQDDAAAWLRAGDAARNRGKPNLAITLYRRARGDSILPALHLIGIYREQSATDAALSEAQLLARTANSPRGHFSAGVVQLLQGMNAGALDEFNTALTPNVEPELKPYIYLGIGHAQLAMNAASEAVASYQRALDAGATDASAYRALARALTKAEQPDKAIDVLETARGREPGNIQVREDLAALYRDQGVRLYGKEKYEEAGTWLDKALSLNPDTQSVVSDAATHRAWILAFHSDPPQTENAIRLLSVATKANPNNEWALRQLGVLNQRAQKYDEAVRNFQSAIATGLRYGDYWALADVYLEMNQIDLAIGTLQKAIGVGGSEVLESYIRLAQAYTERSDTDLALLALESARKIDPKDDWNWRQQAATLRQAARYEESIQASEQSLKLRVTCHAYGGLADTYDSQRRFPEAVAMYRKALDTGNDCAAVAVNLALSLASMGKEAEAVDALEKFLGPERNADSAYWALVNVYGRLGKPELARAQLEPLLDKYPDSSALLGALALLYHEYLFEFQRAYQARRAGIKDYKEASS